LSSTLRDYGLPPAEPYKRKQSAAIKQLPYCTNKLCITLQSSLKQFYSDPGRAARAFKLTDRYRICTKFYGLPLGQGHNSDNGQSQLYTVSWDNHACIFAVRENRGWKVI